MDWVEDARENMEEFFDYADQEEIDRALEEASYGLYKNVDMPGFLIPKGLLSCNSEISK